MNTELEVLKKILKGKNKTSVRSISTHLGFGADYVRFICKKLKEKDSIKLLQRDWYQITPKGQQELKRRGFIKKNLRKRRTKIENPGWDRVQIPVIPSCQAIQVKSSKLKPNFKEPKEEILKLGKKIEETATSLQNVKKFSS